MNGVFKEPENAGRGTRLVNVFDLYGDTSVNLELVDRLELSPQDIEKYRVSIGDIFFTRSSLKPEGVAWSAYLKDGTEEEAVFECHIIRARVDRDRAVPGFVSNYARTTIGRAFLIARANQTTMATIDQDGISELPIVLPKPHKQKELLYALEKARLRQKKMLADADDLLAGLDGFVLGQLGLTLPPPDESLVHAVRLADVRGGRCDALFHAPRFRRAVTLLKSSPLLKISLGTLSPDLAGGATPTRGDLELYAQDGIRFLRIMNIAPFEVRVKDVKYIAHEVHEGDLSRSRLRADDVLMTITGRVGTAAVVTDEVLPANINQHIVRIRLIDDTVLPEYLAAYLNCSFGLMLTNRGVTGGTRIAIDYGTVRGLQIPIPDSKVQSKIAAEVARRRTESRRLRAEADALWDQAKADFEAALLGPMK